MDTLHHVLRSLRGEPPRRDHLSVFREFLSHLDRVGRRPRAAAHKSAQNSKRNSRRSDKR